MLVVTLVAPIGSGSGHQAPPSGVASQQYQTVEELVTVLITALNARDSERVASIYQGPIPWPPCNTLELVVAHALLAGSSVVPGVGLEMFEQSKASLVSDVIVFPPIPNADRSIVLFTLGWAYSFRFDSEIRTEEMEIQVTWEVKEYVDGLRVIKQTTEPRQSYLCT